MDARYAILLSLRGAQAANTGVRTLLGSFSSIPGTLSSANQSLFYLTNNLRSMYNVGAKVTEMINDAFLAPNEAYEVHRLKLKQLLGSMDAAQARIEYYYDFANRTPFLNADVLGGGALLENAGGSELSTGKNLEMVADMAAFAEEQFKDTSYWVAKFYSTVEAGNVGALAEVLNHFMEVNLLGGKQKAMIDDLGKSGASSAEVWEAFTTAMEKHKGMAAAMGETWRGVKSTISGQITEMKRLTGLALFEEMQADITSLRDSLGDLFESGRVDNWSAGIGKEIAAAYEGLKDFTFAGVTFDDILDSLDQGKFFELSGEIFKAAADNFWKQMLYGAQIYGPEVQKALLPEKLHEFLGLNESSDMARMARGGATNKDFEQYQQELFNFWHENDKGKTGMFSIVSRADKNEWANMSTADRRDLARRFAGSQPGLTPPDKTTVDNNLLFKLRNQDILPTLASIKPDMFATGGFNVSGYRYMDPSTGQSAFYDASELKDILSKMNLTAEASERAAAHLESASRTLAETAGEGARL